MRSARVFKSGNSQAVRLPKQFRCESDDVEILQRGEEVILREKSRGMRRAFELLASLPIDADVVEELRKEQPQERDGL